MLTAVILAKNEARNLPACLKSLQFADQILVIDDNSADQTVQIAKKHGARAITHPLSGDYAAQHNFAISAVKSGWILFVDADERVSQPLAAEITQAITRIEYTGYYLRRLDQLWGRQLHYGDTGRVWLLRLARKGAGQWSGRVHETWNIIGRTKRLKSPLDHLPHPSVVDFLHRINFYSTLRAEELQTQGKKSSLVQIIFYPLFKFLRLYILSLGFLDAIQGFIHAMMMAFYSFLVRGKLWLLSKDIPGHQ